MKESPSSFSQRLYLPTAFCSHGRPLSNSSFSLLTCSTQVHDSSWSGFPLSLFPLVLLHYMPVCIPQSHGCQAPLGLEETCVLRGAVWPQEGKTVEQWRVHTLQVCNHRSGDPCVTSSPWHLHSPIKATPASRQVGPVIDSFSRRWPLEVVPVLFSNQDDAECFRDSVFLLAAAGLVEQRKMMWTSWMPAFPLHMICKETKEKLSHSKLLTGAMASKPLMSAKGEGARVQLQAELDPRKGFCFCFRDPVAVFLFLQPVSTSCTEPVLHLLRWSG